MELKRVSFNIDKEVHTNIKVYAAKNNTNASALYRRWILEGYNKLIENNKE